MQQDDFIQIIHSNGQARVKLPELTGEMRNAYSRYFPITGPNDLVTAIHVSAAKLCLKYGFHKPAAFYDVFCSFFSYGCANGEAGFEAKIQCGIDKLHEAAADENFDIKEFINTWPRAIKIKRRRVVFSDPLAVEVEISNEPAEEELIDYAAKIVPY